MSSVETHHELRNGETIRAYLDELARLKTPVQLWLPADDKPFETTLSHVSPITFSSTTTPQLEPGQTLDLSFMLEARRFIARVKALSSGVFRIPLTIAQGERRAEYRGAFERSEPAVVMAVEHCSGTVLGGKFLLGKLLDLSPHGLRIALGEVGSLSGPGDGLKIGDRFASICITGLPFTPPIHGRARVAHVAQTAAEPYAGLALEGLTDADQRNVERVLAPRLPTTFGEAFPAKKRKTDIADELGTPTAVKVKAKAPEIVQREPPPPAAPERPVTTPVMRLRKASKKLLFLSEHRMTPALAEAFRQDGFKHVVEVKSYPEAKAAASQAKFDLLFLDVRVGRHWGGDMMKSLRDLDLLVDVPIILLVDHSTDGALVIARSLEAIWIHERSKPFEDLLPLVYQVVLE